VDHWICPPCVERADPLTPEGAIVRAYDLAYRDDEQDNTWLLELLRPHAESAIERYRKDRSEVKVGS
jgi:hypothetical protein